MGADTRGFPPPVSAARRTTLVDALRRGRVLRAMLFVASVFSTAAPAVRMLHAQDAAEVSPRVTLTLRGVPVVEALDRLVAATGVNLAYDPAVVGTGVVYCQGNDVAAETLLRCIVREAGLDFYRLSSGTYVVIASASAAPQLATFTGVVFDAHTGEPLPSARVALADAARLRPVNNGGAFLFSTLLPGRYRLRVQAMGYRPYETEVQLNPGAPARWRVPLERLPMALDLVSVTGIVAPVSATSAEATSVVSDSLPAMLGPGALFRAAANQLGVGQRALAGDLNIQGGEGGEHQYRIDGVPVFDPISLARLFGSFSPLAVQRLTVRKAGFGVAHGSFTAGVIDLEHSLGADGETGAVSIDPYSYGVRVGGATVIGSRKTRGMLTARRSLWDVAPTPSVREAMHQWAQVDRVLLGQAVGDLSNVASGTPFVSELTQPDLLFTDVHGAVRTDLGAFSALSASFYVSDNATRTAVSASAPTLDGGLARVATRDDYTWTTAGGMVRHEWFPTARTATDVRVRHSQHVLDHRHEALLEGGAARSPAATPHEGNSVSETALEGSVRYSASDRTTLSVGAELARTQSSVEMDNAIFRAVRSSNRAVRVAQFTNVQQQLGTNVQLDAGLRLTWVPTFATVYGEPRIALSGEQFTNSGSVAWRVATGVYRQFITQYDLPAIGPTSVVPGIRFWLPVDGTIRPSEAYHTAGEMVWRTNSGWEVRTETYAKWLPAIPALDYSVLLGAGGAMPYDAPQSMFIGTSAGRTLGAGVRIARDRTRYRAQVGVDVGSSQRTFPGRFDGLAQTTPWNESQRLITALEWRPAPGLSLSGQSRSVFGRGWALRRAYYDLAVDGLPVSAPGNDRLPTLHEVDVGLAQDIQVGRVRTAVQLTILNAFARANVVDRWIVSDSHNVTDNTTFGTIARNGIGRQFILGLQLRL